MIKKSSVAVYSVAISSDTSRTPKLALSRSMRLAAQSNLIYLSIYDSPITINVGAKLNKNAETIKKKL